MHLDLLQVLAETGPVVRGVLIILLVSSLISWSIILKKYWSFKKLGREDKKFQSYFDKTDSLEEIYLQAKEVKGACFSRLYARSHESLKKLLSKEVSDEKSLSETFDRKRNLILSVVERTLAKHYSDIQEELEKGLSVLASIASLAVFIGLFGTVWGIINSFNGLASGGGGSIEAVAPGIAEALVATAIGLATAIPASLFFNVFTHKVSKISNSMERFSQDYLNLIETEILE